MVMGLPLRFGRMWPLSSMLAPPEKDLNTSRVNLGRFAGRLIGGVREKAEKEWKERRMGSLFGVTPKAKCIQFVSYTLPFSFLVFSPFFYSKWVIGP